MINCPNCKIKNKPRAKFCKDCGLRFVSDSNIVCRKCDLENKKNSKFCKNCGSDLIKNSIVSSKRYIAKNLSSRAQKLFKSFVTTHYLKLGSVSTIVLITYLSFSLVSLQDKHDGLRGRYNRLDSRHDELGRKYDNLGNNYNNLNNNYNRDANFSYRVDDIRYDGDTQLFYIACEGSTRSSTMLQYNSSLRSYYVSGRGSVGNQYQAAKYACND